MEIRMRCTSHSDNDPGPGQEPLYNLTLTAVRDDDSNKDKFGGTPAATLSLMGLKESPCGYGDTVTISIGGPGQATARAPGARQQDPQPGSAFRGRPPAPRPSGQGGQLQTSDRPG